MKRRSILITLIALISLLALCTSAAAESFTINTSSWNQDKYKMDTSYSLNKQYKYVNMKIWYSSKSTSWTPYKRLTPSYKHFKGESNQTRGMSTTKNLQLEGSCSGSNASLIKNYGLSFGFKYSITTTSTVNDNISATLKDGWYYYGQRGKLKGYKYVTFKETYKKNNKGTYVYQSKTADNVSKATVLDSATYCTWVYDCPIDD